MQDVNRWLYYLPSCILVHFHSGNRVAKQQDPEILAVRGLKGNHPQMAEYVISELLLLFLFLVVASISSSSSSGGGGGGSSSSR